ncbi:hypothetical protein [Xanthomonas euvesicatoria]|uniref:hypothetical protein n=1 Tax=Xanthomonas euvesicatoria TaxID=456327 RepID=UPI0030C7FAA0
MGILSDLQEEIYDALASYGELKALERLFSKKYLSGLEKSEEDALGKSALRKVYVDLAWIDKIPLAQFCVPQKDFAGHPIKSKVELGDLLVHRTDSILNGNKTYVRDSRSAIIQAKISTTSQPVVPVGRVSPERATSTSKEIKLLQDWPEFDLFETSRSKAAELNRVQINNSQDNSFFWAFVKPSKQWLSGLADNGAICSETLDEFFSKLRDRTYGQCTQAKDQWADLTFAILGVAKNRKIPASLNKQLRCRVQRATYEVAGMGRLVRFRKPMAILMIDVVLDEGSG